MFTPEKKPTSEQPEGQNMTLEALQKEIEERARHTEQYPYTNGACL